MNMEIEKVDERQKSMQRKYGNQSFALMMILTIVNAVICEFVHEWAGPMVSALTIVCASLSYYAVRNILSGSLGKIVDKKKLVLLMIPFFIAGLAVGGAMGAKSYVLIENGKATVHLWNLLFVLLVIPPVIAYLIVRRRDKRNGE